MALLPHGERAGQRDLDLAVGIGAQELKIAHFDRPAPFDGGMHARHLNFSPCTALDRRRIVGIHAFERRDKIIRIAFAAHFAIGDDVDAGALHVADRQDCRVILRFLQAVRGDAPQFMHVDARHALGKQRAVDQPVGLRIAADDGGGEEFHFLIFGYFETKHVIFPHIVSGQP